MTKFVQLVIIGVSALSYGSNDTSFSYILILSSFPVLFFLIPIIKSRAKKNELIFVRKNYLAYSFVYTPAILFFSWVYGVCIGILRNVPIEHVFRNFFGLVVYLWFYILIAFRPSTKSLMNALLIGGIIQLFYGLIISLNSEVEIASILSGKSISEGRSLYSSGFMMLFPLISLALSSEKISSSCTKLFYTTKICKNPIFFLLCLYTVVIPSLSKGFILGLVTLIAYHCTQYTLSNLEKRSLVKNVVFPSLLVVFCIFIFNPSPELINVISSSFSSDEVSNAVRSEQFNKIASDFTFFGSGLGAKLSSGYQRDDSGYGFELTFLNLVHKLGFFVIPLFTSYFLTVFISMSNVFRKIKIQESCTALGCMVYLIPGTGNPLLLSPPAVILHCLAMYLLVTPAAEIIQTEIGAFSNQNP